MEPLSTFYLFATSVGAGIAAALPFVPLKELGRRFFVLMSLIALGFIVLATVSRGLGIGYAWVACGGFLIAYNVSLPRQAADPGWRPSSGRDEPGTSSRKRITPSGLFLAGAIASGAAGLTADALDLAGSAGAADMLSLLVVAASISSAFLLGATVLTMVLGHWYLVARGLSFTPLRRLTNIVAAALALRLALAGLGVWQQAGRWDAMLAEAGWTSFFLSDGVFVVTRVLFGFLVPLVLVKLVWDCLRAESNQSATGILYVMVAFVLIGEMLSKHFLVSPSALVL